MTDTVLRLTNISKRFGKLLANDDISLTLKRGEVLALLGENGAGKSTLVSILFGHYTADAGQIEVFGQPLPAGDPKAALAAGIGMVHQHFTLADNLSVLENVMMGSEPLWQPFTRQRAARAKLQEVAQRFGLEVDAQAKVGSLSVGERQRVEILKALYRGARILILDEPTAVLTPQESEDLFTVLAQMVAQGLSIIFISHKLAEVLRVSSRVAVLRNGRLVNEANACDTTQSQLAQWMVGHAIEAPRRHEAGQIGEDVCVLQGVSSGSGRERLDGVSLTLRRGEIVAIAGVSGNGQVALAELLCGTRRASSGRVELLGRVLPAAPAQLVALGVARIPEDRHAVGVIGDLPVWENAVSERLRSHSFSRGGWVRRKAARAYAQRVVDAFDVRGGGADSAARSLSGGNMQKLILGRALLHPDTDHANRHCEEHSDAAIHAVGRHGSPRYARDDEGALAMTSAPNLIVAHQPTWGLDIGAVSYVQAQLIAARDAGAAVLLISDDLDEVLTLGDRVAVMHGGKLTEALPAAAWSRESIGLAMAGSASGSHT
jgi:simple sugar transport system ATP-binding protein